MRARSDPWLWLILFLGLGARLIEVDAPLIDQQAWRQTDTAAIARNYFEEGFDLFHPRVDWRGTTSGFVETNFPLYPFLVACVYKIAGASMEWIGRLLSALLCTGSAALLYLLAFRLYNDVWIARFSSGLFLVFPLNIYFGRAFMPEALMLFLSVGTILSFLRWTSTESVHDFISSVVFAGLCYVVKIPTLYLGFPLVAIAWSRWGWSFIRKPILWFYCVLTVIPSVLWYAHAASLFEQTGLTFGIWNRYGYDKWNHNLLLNSEYYLTIGWRIIHRVFTPMGALFVCVGAVMRWPKFSATILQDHEMAINRREYMLFAWLAGLLLYILAVPEGNRGLHYYQLPLVPIGALLAAIPLAHAAGAGPTGSRTIGTRNLFRPDSTAWKAIIIIGYCGIITYGAVTLGDYYRPGNNMYNYYLSSWKAGKIIDQRLPEDALVVVGDIDENAATPYRARSPTMLYYCNRKGWQITPQEFTSAKLDSLTSRGAGYFVAGYRYAAADSTFWQDLARRGLSYPTAYPTKWKEGSAFLRAAHNHPGLDRHFVVVDLDVAG